MKNKIINELNSIISKELDRVRMGDGDTLDLDIIDDMNRSKIIRKCGNIHRLIIELESELELLEEYSFKY